MQTDALVRLLEISNLLLVDSVCTLSSFYVFMALVRMLAHADLYLSGTQGVGFKKGMSKMLDF